MYSLSMSENREDTEIHKNTEVSNLTEIIPNLEIYVETV
jgi:hypothetical protein